jgi:hypothetical protein
LEHFVIALILRLAGFVIPMMEIEPTGKLPLAEGTETEMKIKKVSQAEEGEGKTHAVHLVEIDHGVGSDSIQCFIDFDEALLLFEAEKLHVVHAGEERHEQGRSGDSEADIGVGFSVIMHQRCHEGNVAESGEAYDQNVLHFL